MYNKKELEDAFDFVCNRDDWRAPIDAVIPSEKEQVVREAIVYFTGTEPTFRHYAKSLLSCTAVGYRNGPCGP